ncbi:uncharacterized protein BX664DRAFT_291854 [Halteromyces radiatus]|uniref:uncharacterized protein n=1 Tax=Halteromyces radiatus TaxID=101107 RepID=UPI00221F2EF8|nr:uncharacterized protein BX664DRAFT_291854 [Halteromyces radiatus]KAI8096757.1 hypothetical protein BX664DRAFT_291854 [Halteromyces radiatus]
MLPEYPVDLAILGSYFALIGILVWRISPQLIQSFQQPGVATTCWLGRMGFLGLAGASFMATWTFMFAYFAHSYLLWKSYYGVVQSFSLNLMSQWLHGVQLFDDAWRTVCTGNWAWLWSIQLCTFTVSVWTPIIAIEGYRRRVPHVWAYMIIGQVVAISTSSAFFFAVLLMCQDQQRQQQSSSASSTFPPWFLIFLLGLVSFGGLITVALTPHLTSSYRFLPNLLVMHGLLLLPLLYLAFTSSSSSTRIKQTAVCHHLKSYAIIAIYCFGACANTYLIIQQWKRTVYSNNMILDPLVILSHLADTFLQHPAQSSISSDVVFVYLISMTWMIVDSWPRTFTFVTHPSLVYFLVALTPFSSPSITLPLYLALNEYCHHLSISTSIKIE